MAITGAAPSPALFPAAVRRGDDDFWRGLRAGAAVSCRTRGHRRFGAGDSFGRFGLDLDIGLLGDQSDVGGAIAPEFHDGELSPAGLSARLQPARGALGRSAPERLSPERLSPEHAKPLPRTMETLPAFRLLIGNVDNVVLVLAERVDIDIADQHDFTAEVSPSTF